MLFFLESIPSQINYSMFIHILVFFSDHIFISIYRECGHIFLTYTSLELAFKEEFFFFHIFCLQLR